MDTMTGTKIVGAFCGTLLIFLLGSWAAEELYHVGAEHHAGDYGDGHGDEITQAYAIEVADSGEAEDAAPEVPFAEVYAAADAGAGERIWRQCSACHKLDGSNGTGPYLNGVIGRAQGGVDGYAYSASFAELGGTWTPEEMSGFLLAPGEWVPGTKMNYRGLSDVEDRANLIAYLETTS